ncbi:hypothetical protein FZC76_14325 [Sutcliffiella horikoshii]|uniref:Uncharacterized protein n=1 Tax=Sutcliffiella horikoshii TaxID=79883 RepID=A0A5D4SWD0_9BACI|nr:hypothetical protein [Sutcliffiella horikoshii]TYS67737.1 hypothetical protein FZC76_14325 [Sutcliffiella horikoshii]
MKKILLLIISAIAIPIGIALIGGGGFILLNLAGGIPIDDSIKTIGSFQEKAQPYIKYMLILIALPLLLKSMKKKH